MAFLAVLVIWAMALVTIGLFNLLHKVWGKLTCDNRNKFFNWYGDRPDLGIYFYTFFGLVFPVFLIDTLILALGGWAFMIAFAYFVWDFYNTVERKKEPYDAVFFTVDPKRNKQ